MVLPFEDLSEGGQQAAFAAGLTDDLIADLSKVSELFVIAPETSRIAGKSDSSAQTIGAAMGVDYVLLGTVRRSQAMFRITAQLVRTTTGQAVWAEHYDRRASDIFDVQDDVVQRIAASLKIELNDRERRTITRIPTKNLEAHDFYLRAEYQNAGLEEATSYRRSIAAYRRAIELDPNFAEAYAGYAHLAATIWRRDVNEIMSSAVARQEAYVAAGKALELDPENARANEVLSTIQAVEGEHQIAVDSARKAVKLQPSEAEAHTNLANVLYIAGDLDAAAAEVEVARQLNPALSTDLRLVSASVAFGQGRYAEAIEQFDAIQELVPRSDLVLEHLAAAHAYLGDTKRSHEIVAELLKIIPIANLGFYAVLRENTGTPEQTARLIEGLRLAGLPEWPFDDRRQAEDRLGADELRAVAAGPLWTGELQNGVDFVQYFDRTGGFAYRSTTSLLTGHIAVQGDRLCQIIDGYLLNHPTCGYVYRNMSAADHRAGDFAYVSVDAVKYFSVSR
ncbi:MAG: tetratricopeptide repeat protein [Rhizobiales bacterium]|nr:tetratricopeptide repeat protein [Hyphomicrobiales bacterium]